MSHHTYYFFTYLLKKSNLQLDNSHLVEITNYLTKFFVRRNLTDFPNTRNLAKIFMDIIDLIKDKNGDEVLSIIKAKLRSESAKDEVFAGALRGPIYLNNVDSTRFLLCYYEDIFATKESKKDLWARDRNARYIWTIEHIFPEGENIPQAWVDMIASGDLDKAKDFQVVYCHQLGNLTLTGYNQNLSNLSFEDKKKRNIDGKKIGYENGLKLNEEIVTKTKWTIEDIVERTNKLVDFFLNEFEL